jgi:hypothetical protein
MMSAAWAITVSPLAGLVADIVAQTLCAHLVRRTGLSIATGGVAGLLGTIVVLAGVAANGRDGFEWAGAVMSVLTYFAFAFGYWTFLNLNITSLRIRILREILRGGESGISRDGLMKRYSAQEFLRRRLERLEAGGTLTHEAGIWRLDSSTLLMLARSLAFARAVIVPSQRDE